MSRPRSNRDRVQSRATHMNADPEETDPMMPNTGQREPAHRSLSTWQSLKGDRNNIALLTFLYVLQGIPLGLAGSIPYLLSSRHVHYHEQAIFSFVYWPFSVKLLWAPIVDSLYFNRIGRRKSWLIPVQFLIGAFMLGLSPFIPSLLGEDETSPSAINVLPLTVIFFCLNFLAATQDIAVDGWALTMLSRRNVNWASTCNTVGQTAGYFMGNVVFLAFESAEFCNNYIRSTPQPYGLLTLSGFLYFWSIVFFVSTAILAIFKGESAQTEEEQSVKQAYFQLVRLFKLPSIFSLVIILLTAKVGFAAADAITGLKLIEAGVPREKLALLGVPMVPIQIILPILISKYTAGKQSMDIFLKAIPFRLMMGLGFAAIVWYTPTFKDAAGGYPFHYYLFILAAYAVHQVFLFCMFVSQMAFFATISDPAIGGTYMTLLNTITNFGGNWPSTLALWLVDPLTSTECLKGEDVLEVDCYNNEQACTEVGGTCQTSVDGYYVQSVICFLIGWIWLFFMQSRVKRLQSLPHSAWKSP